MRLSVTGTLRTTGTTTSVFVWWLVLLRALFSIRAGGWEFIGSIEEESRPIPVMRVTSSKNKTEVGILVSDELKGYLSPIIKYF